MKQPLLEYTSNDTPFRSSYPLEACGLRTFPSLAYLTVPIPSAARYSVLFHFHPLLFHIRPSIDEIRISNT